MIQALNRKLFPVCTDRDSTKLIGLSRASRQPTASTNSSEACASWGELFGRHPDTNQPGRPPRHEQPRTNHISELTSDLRGVIVSARLMKRH